jgi:hypothetical protein
MTDTAPEDQGIHIDPNEVFTWIKHNHPDVFAAGCNAVAISQANINEAMKRQVAGTVAAAPRKNIPAKRPVKKTARTGAAKKK